MISVTAEVGDKSARGLRRSIKIHKKAIVFSIYSVIVNILYLGGVKYVGVRRKACDSTLEGLGGAVVITEEEGGIQNGGGVISEFQTRVRFGYRIL